MFAKRKRNSHKLHRGCSLLWLNDQEGRGQCLCSIGHGGRGGVGGDEGGGGGLKRAGGWLEGAVISILSPNAPFSGTYTELQLRVGVGGGSKECKDEQTWTKSSKKIHSHPPTSLR